MADVDILQYLSDTEIPKLLDVLERDIPQSLVAHHWLRMQLDWQKKIAGLKVYVLCPHGDWSDGTVIAYADGLAAGGRQYGVLYARQGAGDAKLGEALLKTRLIPWRTMIHFTSVHERHVGYLRAAAEAAGVKLPRPQPLACLVYLPYQIPEELQNAVVAPEPPLSLKKLNRSHLNEVWALRPFFPESLRPVMEAMLEHNHSAGIFVQDPSGSERLVSMVLEGEHGGLAMGQTHEDFQKKGLSTTAGMSVMISMIKEGKKPHGTTWVTNDFIVKWIVRSGFDIVGRTVRVEIAPGYSNDSHL